MSDQSIQLIVGLGNPGSEYADTRHNAGVWFLEQLADAEGCQFRTETKFKGLVSRVSLGGHETRLLIPTTFMNHSGMAVVTVAKFYKIPPQAILVVHDELDLPVGVSRLKYGGGHGGHNGLRDIIGHLGSRDFYRLRIGVGKPKDSASTVDYVLKKPSHHDYQQISDAMYDASRVMPAVVDGQFDDAMKQLHTGN